MQKFIFRVLNGGLTALCFLFYNPPMHVAVVRIFS
jgi:hypothetical protein